MAIYLVQRSDGDNWITLMQSDFEDTQQFRVIAQCQYYRILRDGKDITRKFRSPVSIQTTPEWRASRSEVSVTDRPSVVSNHVCIAGNLKMKRADLVALLNRAGFVVKEDVTSRTQYFITNFINGTTGNHVKARKLQTKTLTEQEAIAICNEKINAQSPKDSSSTVRRRGLLGGQI